MATFVLVPGAGGVAWYWHRVVPLLDKAKQQAIAVDLPGDDEHADSRGMIDRHALMRRAILGLPDHVHQPTIESEIAKLQRDASYLWVPTDEHWSVLSRVLKLPISELRRALTS
jgi:hypothetical protein